MIQFVIRIFITCVALYLRGSYCTSTSFVQHGVASVGVWCFTTDPHVPWELCSVPRCDATYKCQQGDSLGVSYSGNMNTSVSGRTATRFNLWDCANTQHKWTISNDECSEGKHYTPMLKLTGCKEEGELKSSELPPLCSQSA